MLITILSIFFILVVFYKLFKSSKNLTLIFFIVVPFICSFFWLTYDSLDWFKWVKAYSLAIIVVAITITKYKKFYNSKKIFNFIYAFLAINIIEALIKDFASLNFTSIINIFIGSVLVFSLIDSNHNIHIDLNSKSKDLITPKLNRSWIFVYTLWNWLYVYSEYPEFALKHIAVLSVPIIFELFNKGTWLQARAITLGFHVIFSITTNPYIDQYIPKLNPDFIFIPTAIVLINLSFLTYSLFFKNIKVFIRIPRIIKEKSVILTNFLFSILK